MPTTSIVADSHGSERLAIIGSAGNDRAARVERIRAHFAVQAAADLRGARRTAVMRLRLLQDTTRRALTDRHRGGFWLNRRDPMRLFVDRPYLDDAIERLFGGG